MEIEGVRLYFTISFLSQDSRGHYYLYTFALSFLKKKETLEFSVHCMYTPMKHGMTTDELQTLLLSGKIRRHYLAVGNEEFVLNFL